MAEVANGAGAAGAGPSSGELFTRGGPNVPDNRGQSMVSRGSQNQGLQPQGRRRRCCRHGRRCCRPAFCSRAGLTAPAPFGRPQVAKHLEKQQKEKEARAMERLHLLLPALGPTVRAVALQQCNWDEEKALTMLRRFQVGSQAALSLLLASQQTKFGVWGSSWTRRVSHHAAHTV